MDYSSWIPTQPGMLPRWLLFISAVSVLNGLSAMFSPSGARRVYPYTPKPVDDHAARLFGTWTLLSGVIRFYGAYHVDEPVVYQIVFWTYAIALLHFGVETLVFRTTGPKTAAASTYVVAVGTVAWMSWARDYYVQ